jgi:4-hydroxybenzoate polyprenyltransferase
MLAENGLSVLVGERRRKEIGMLWALAVILIVLWLAGFLVVHVGGALIHLLLVIAAIVLIYQFVTGRRAL